MLYRGEGFRCRWGVVVTDAVERPFWDLTRGRVLAVLGEAESSSSPNNTISWRRWTLMALCDDLEAQLTIAKTTRAAFATAVHHLDT